MSGSFKKVLGLLLAMAALSAVIGVYVAFYLTAAPPSLAAARTSSGAQLYLATVPAAEPNDPHNTWVSFYAVNSSSGDWRHATTYVLPTHTLVHVTIFQYDSASGLRNPFISQASGTVGGKMTLDGRAVSSINPADASHVFAVPQIGLSIPLQGVADDAKNSCAQAPCSLANAHQTISFSFRTPGRGLYRWQCFVPCAAGYIDGFGGPMQTVGYMDGFIKVI
jgi:hypothetical protein